ncbi:MAG TPA: CapA family protein [Bryobacteraceae bacterium]|nr:CapA family protein [Bryobacteraceae bacterium]
MPAIALLLSCSRDRIPPPPQPARVVAKFNRLLFAGDVMLSRGVRRQILAARDPALPFRKIAPLLASADLAFVNLESPFSDHGPYHPDGLIFHAAPEMIAGLELAHIAVASTANNHARDCGPHGVEFTVKWLCEHQIQPVGSSESEERTHRGIVLARHGIRFGFLGYTYDQQNGNWRDIDKRIAITDIAQMTRDVQDLRERSDVVIVSMHSGTEYMPKPNQAQIHFAHAAIDAGAKLVIGHHPHVIQPRENYRGGVIFYSLGNFIFDQFQREATQHGEIAEVDFLESQIFVANTWPVRITATGPQIE